MEERAIKIRNAHKRYFERNGSWEGATLSLLALEDVDSLMKKGGMGQGGEEEVGGNYLKGYLMGEEEEGTRPLDNRGDKESMGSTAAATTMHDEGGKVRLMMSIQT